MTQRPEVGFFGKLPGSGDFVQRRLPGEFVERWDEGLRRAVERSQQELGDDWRAAARQGPAWRFMLPPGVCGGSGWVGVVGPGEDSVGRCYPLVLAAPFNGKQDAAVRVLRSQAWFEALEQTLIDARQSALGVQAFDAQVAALAGPQTMVSPDPAWLLRQMDWSRGQWRLPLGSDGVFLSRAWNELASRPGWCLWWTSGHGGLAPCVLATEGLPGSYSALLGTPLPMASMATSLPTPNEPDPVVASSEVTPAVLHFPSAKLVLIAADEMTGPRYRAAAQVQAALPQHADFVQIRERLRRLHVQVRDVSQVAPEPAHENAAVIVARFSHGGMQWLGVGNVMAWHWRGGRLRSLCSASPTARVRDDWSELLFGAAEPAVPGLGGRDEPAIREGQCDLLAGDRLALLATHGLSRLDADTVARAMALPDTAQAAAQLAHCAGLPTDTTSWPFFVTEIAA